MNILGLSHSVYRIIFVSSLNLRTQPSDAKACLGVGEVSSSRKSPSGAALFAHTILGNPQIKTRFLLSCIENMYFPACSFKIVPGAVHRAGPQWWSGSVCYPTGPFVRRRPPHTSALSLADPHHASKM